MTELVFKNEIESTKLDAIIEFINSLGVYTEIRTTTKKKEENDSRPFTESFGMWAGRDIDIKQIREQTRQRRTKPLNHDTL